MNGPYQVITLFMCLSTVLIINSNSDSSIFVQSFRPAMNLVNLQGSVKNIPIPSPKVYLMMLINSIETLCREMEWAANIFLNPRSKTTKRTFNFRSIRNPEKVKDLVKFKSDMLKIVKSIQFKKGKTKFQRKQKEHSILDQSEIRKKSKI